MLGDGGHGCLLFSHLVADELGQALDFQIQFLQVVCLDDLGEVVNGHASGPPG